MVTQGRRYGGISIGCRVLSLPVNCLEKRGEEDNEIDGFKAAAPFRPLRVVDPYPDCGGTANHVSICDDEATLGDRDP